MSHIYIYEGPFEKGEGNWPLIRRAGALYTQERGLDFPVFETEIIRTEQGKPCFTDIPLEFSLTHSGHLLMCMVGEAPCGLDLQEVKACDFEKLSARFFTPAEHHYVKLWGAEGFFDIWVRKEAFCKCTGQGFFSEMPSVADENADLLKKVNQKGRDYYFTEIQISPELKAAACTVCEEQIEMRLL